jgi:hypothetical protein
LVNSSEGETTLEDVPKTNIIKSILEVFSSVFLNAQSWKKAQKL